MRRVLGLALAAEGVRDLGREPAERLTGRIYDNPVALAIRGGGDKSLHLQTGEGSGPIRDPPGRSIYCPPLVVPAESRPATGRERGTHLGTLSGRRSPGANR